jgi:hypothetical protein
VIRLFEGPLDGGNPGLHGSIVSRPLRLNRTRFARKGKIKTCSKDYLRTPKQFKISALEQLVVVLVRAGWSYKANKGEAMHSVFRESLILGHVVQFVLGLHARQDLFPR